jgi:hypothetical protein
VICSSVCPLLQSSFNVAYNARCYTIPGKA